MSFPPGTEMFQFPGFAFIPLWIQGINTSIQTTEDRGRRTESQSFPRPSSVICRLEVGFPIRRFPDQSLFAAPRDLSQRTTSFIASQRQGIHQTPF
jgi:hypothetical protein